MAFTGFGKEALDFLTEIRMNNSQDFYDANRERYERFVKAPLRALCEEMAPVVQLIDPKLDVRPGSVMSRLRRDTRFTRDKSPFRDHVWLGWRYPGERRSEGFHMYWGFGPDWLGWGCGSYSADRPLMDALRVLIRRDPRQVERALAQLELGKRYTLYGEPFRRMTVPPEVPDALRTLYHMKYFGAESVSDSADWDALWSHAAAERLTEELERMAPLLQLMTALRREVQPAAVPATQEADGKNARGLKARRVEEFEF